MRRFVPPPSNVDPPPRSWEAVYATAKKIVPTLLLLMGVAESDLDDVFQNIVFAAYRRFKHFDPAWRSRARPPAPATSSGEAGVPPPCGAAEPSGGVPSASSDSGRPPGPFGKLTPEGAWLYGITWRQVRHYLERAHRRREVPVGLIVATGFERTNPPLDAELRIAVEERRALAIDLLASVPPERRIILVLSDAFEIPMAEIAEALGLKVNTAYNRLRLARRDYRAAVKRLRPEQRKALQVNWLLFLFFPEVLLRAVVEPTGGAGSESVRGPALWKNWKAEWPGRLRRALGPARSRLRWIVAGGIALAPLLLVPAPPTVPWARRFGPIVLPRVVAQGVTSGVNPGAHAGPRHLDPEPRTAAAPEAASATAVVQREVAAPAPRPAKPGRVPIAEEQLWIDAAQDALFRGDLPTALEKLAEHARRFPEGRLRLTRERLRAQAASAVTGAAGDAPDGGQ